jgi:steroid 5-alpha reductase family enzyme
MLLLTGWALLVLVMLATWLWQLRSGNAGIVDVAWALGLGMLALLYAAAADGDPMRRVLVAVLAGGWSLRLGGYLANRVIGREEDSRYAAMRRARPQGVQAFFFYFFQAQALLAVILSVPWLIIATDQRSGFTGVDGLGAAVWLTAVIGEAVADAQLARFRRAPQNKGRTCRTGLWRYSRHPNYFFEWIHWLAYPLLAWGSPWFAITFLSPALMLFFILKVTGIPPTEAQAVASRGDDYRAYQKSTSAFVPWFPRKETP